MIKIEKLNKKYFFNNNVILALKDIDLSFEDKGFVFITGKSGSGKSTILNLIGGLITTDDGVITIDKKNTDDFRDEEWDEYRSKNIGFIFQEFYILEDLTVKDNIKIPLELQGVSNDEIEDKVYSILEKLQIQDLLLKRGNELSGGQLQRVAIARAIIKNPKILLCDEPTGNLDSKYSEIILKILREQSQDKLVIMVTHDNDAALKYGDRIIVISEGEILKDRLNNSKVMFEKIYKGKNSVNDIIMIPKTSENLSVNMINYINDYLHNSTNDNYLEIRLENHINEVSINTNNNLYNPIETVRKIENAIQRSKFNYQTIFRFASKNLLKRKISFAITLIILTMTIFISGFTTNLSLQDTDAIIYDLYKEVNINYIPIYNQENDFVSSVNENDISLLRNSYETIQFYSTRLFYIRYEEILPDDTIGSKGPYNYFYSDKISRIGYLDNTELPLTFGSYPNEINEVMITDYVAEMFVFYKVFGILSEEEIVGESISVNNNNLVISGIIETDYLKYDYLKESINYQEFSDFKKEQYEIYEQLFMYETTYDTFINSNYKTLKRFDISQGNYYYDPHVTYASNVSDDNMWGTFPTEDNEIIVSTSYLFEIIQTLDIPEVINEDTILQYLEKTYKFEYLIDTGNSMIATVEEDFVIVGIIDDRVVDAKFDIAFFDTKLDDIVEQIGYSRVNIIAVLSEDDLKNKEFIKDLYDESDYIQVTPFSNDFLKIKNIIDSSKSIMISVSLAFIIFASIFTYSFMSRVILSQYREIGILRAIGVSKNDISKIVLTEGLIMLILSVLLANGLLAILIKYLNDIIKQNYIDFTIFQFSMISTIGMIIVSTITILLVVNINIRKVLQKNTIDIIKNN
ncbi:MAG: ABC transporter ATP-binding protein/permease [Candidatus Izemoplasma sp.]